MLPYLGNDSTSSETGLKCLQADSVEDHFKSVSDGIGYLPSWRFPGHPYVTHRKCHDTKFHRAKSTHFFDESFRGSFARQWRRNLTMVLPFALLLATSVLGTVLGLVTHHNKAHKEAKKDDSGSTSMESM